MDKSLVTRCDESLIHNSPLSLNLNHLLIEGLKRFTLGQHSGLTFMQREPAIVPVQLPLHLIILMREGCGHWLAPP